VSLCRELLALSASFAVAGYFAGWIAIPTPLGSGTRFSLSLALAVPSFLLACAPGAATHSLAAWNILLGLGLLGGLAAWRAREELRLALLALPDLRLALATSLGRLQLIPTLLVCFAVAATWATVLVPEGIEDTGSGRPNGTIVYYHWGIVDRVVEDGGLPATLPEWGKPREFPYEYAFSVIHGAGTAAIAGDSGFVLEERYRIAMVLMAFFAFLALWRRWLPPWWAFLATLLALNVSRVETRLLVYKPEAFAFILVIWSAWLFDEALERGSRRWGALAGLVLATSFLAHPIGSLLVAPLWGGILIGRVGPAIWQRARKRPIPSLPWRPVLVAVLVFGLLFGGLRTVIGSTGQDLAQSPEAGVDLTRVVYNLAYVSADPMAKPRIPECSEPFGVYSTVRPFFSSNASWFFFDLNSRSSVFLMLGMAILIAGAFLLQPSPRLASWPERAKRAVITWGCYAIGVYLLALLICVYYSTWVPERVGPMRLMPYWALIFPIFLAGVAWAASRGLSGLGLRGLRPSRLDFEGRSAWFGRGVGVMPALLLTLAALWTFTTVDAHRDRGVPPFYIAEPRAGGLSESALKAYDWIEDNLPPRALILANGYTEGALGMLTQRTGVLDGRTPFAQPDPWRAEAIRWLTQSRQFFKHPRRAAIPGGANYVLVARRDVNLGGSYFPTDFRALKREQSLERVYRGEGIALYRVRGDTPAAARRFGQRTAGAVGGPIVSAQWVAGRKGQQMASVERFASRRSC
jgi:Dolichyl-phosphate-mannose-protein mannosyltransferase